jgi:hypothetical protein
MAKKPSKSILSGLKNMLHREPEKRPEPAKKASNPAQKKSTAPAAAAKEQRPAPPAEPSAPAGEAASPSTPDKKKLKNQPWYRHRQRW